VIFFSKRQRLVILIKTPWRLVQNTKAFLKNFKVFFLKPLDVFVWSSDKTTVGLARRPTRFMLED
jgi:hypothetical protein